MAGRGRLPKQVSRDLGQTRLIRLEYLTISDLFHLKTAIAGELQCSAILRDCPHNIVGSQSGRGFMHPQLINLIILFCNPPGVHVSLTYME